MTDDNANQTAWTYDALGRKIEESKGANVSPVDSGVDNDPTFLQWAYFPSGAVRTMTKEDETELDYSYDAVGRLESVESDSVVLREFEYDALGNATFSKEYNGAGSGDDVTVTRIHDSLGRLIEEMQRIGSGDPRYVSSKYVSTRRDAVIYPNDRQVDYAFHGSGALQSVKDHNGGSPVEIAHYDYLGGRLLLRQGANGVNLDFRGQFDALGRPARWAHLDGEGDIVVGQEYGYDRVGNIVALRGLHGDPESPGHWDAQRFAYDSAGRLTAMNRGSFGSGGMPSSPADAAMTAAPAGNPDWAEQAASRRWFLDGLGNWRKTATREADNFLTTPIAYETRTTTTFNEIAAVDPDGPGGASAVAQTQDDNGNTLTDGTRTMTWDAFNRLTRAEKDSSTYYYVYDAENRRMRVDGPSTNDIEYAWDGWQTVERFEGTELEHPKRQFVYGSFIDEPLVMDVDVDDDGDCYLGDDTDDHRYFYLQNNIYNVMALTDEAGAVVEGYAYEPYGRRLTLTAAGTDTTWFTDDDPATLSGASAVGNPYFYTGRDWDAGTGLQYNRERYYVPNEGFFISRDFFASCNLYLCTSNPLRYVDFSGFIEWEVGTEVPAWHFDTDDDPWPPTHGPSENDNAAFNTVAMIIAGSGGESLAPYPQASAALSHYLDNRTNMSDDPASGQFGFDGLKMLRDDLNARRAMADYLLEAAGYARKRNLPGGTPIVGANDPPAADKSGPVAADLNSDWHKAVGGFFVKGKGRTGCSGGKRFLDLTLMMGDRYNFHYNGMGLDIGPLRIIGDNDLARLQAVGLAHAYNREGGALTLTVSDTNTLKSNLDALRIVEDALGMRHAK